MKFRYLAVFLALCAVIALLCSCSPQRRLERLVKRHPELVKVDTIRIKDTIKIKGDRADSVFYYHTSDTVVLDKGRLQVKYYYSRDSVYLSGKCRDSVIVREIPVTVNKVVPVQKANRFYFWVAIVLLSLLSMFLFILWLRTEWSRITRLFP